MHIISLELTPPSAAPQCINIVNDVILVEVPDSSLVNITSVDECCALCRTSVSCVLFEFVPESFDFVATCNLFNTSHAGPFINGTATVGTGAFPQ